MLSLAFHKPLIEPYILQDMSFQKQASQNQKRHGPELSWVNLELQDISCMMHICLKSFSKFDELTQFSVSLCDLLIKQKFVSSLIFPQ